jgi:hypothetical protein
MTLFVVAWLVLAFFLVFKFIFSRFIFIFSSFSALGPCSCSSPLPPLPSWSPAHQGTILAGESDS